MSIYVAVFILAWLFMKFAESLHGRQSRIGAALCILIAVLIPSIVAGMRDVSIGTDTQGYVTKIFNSTVASGGSASQIYHSFGGTYQIAYVALAQIGHVIPDIHAFLFVVALVTFGVAAIAFNVFDRAHMAVPYLVYLLLNFNQSMNNSRQSVAISFGLLAAAALLRKRRVLMIVALVLAFLFHKSAIVLLSYIPIYLITEWGRDYESNTRQRPSMFRGMMITLSVVAMVGMVVEFQALGPKLLSVLGMEQEYGQYLTQYRAGVSRHIAEGNVALFLLVFLLRKRRRGGNFLALGTLYGVIVYFLTGISVYMYRVSIYFTCFPAMVCANSYLRSQQRKDALAQAELDGEDPRNVPLPSAFSWETLGRWLVVIVSALLWYLQIVIYKNNATYPYTSQILGIG